MFQSSLSIILVVLAAVLMPVSIIASVAVFAVAAALEIWLGNGVE